MAQRGTFGHNERCHLKAKKEKKGIKKTSVAKK
jgi:hypothetical protein